MSGNKALLDSNVFIYASKGMDLDFLNRYNEFYVSIITYMEVLGFNFSNNREEKVIKDLLTEFDIIFINIDIAKVVISIRKKKKIKLPDAIIYATAAEKGCDLLTYNISDFENIDDKVEIVQPSS